jgi:hypothetical protein
MHGSDLAGRGIVTVEYEDIVDHGVDLRERYLILPWPQVWRNVEELHVHVRLDGKRPVSSWYAGGREKKKIVPRKGGTEL